MSSVTKLNFYKKMKCANCGYSWDYPFSNVSAMSDLQNLFYFELHLCPHCNSLGDMITEVGQFELDIQKDKNYKAIIKDRNQPFGMACRKESYRYELYAYICECKGDKFKASKAYYMASKVERYQRIKYFESMIYNEQKDAKMIDASIEKEELFMKKAQNYMISYLHDNLNDIDASIMLAVLYKLNKDEANSILMLNSVMKKNVDSRQIRMVKEVMAMPIGPSDFLKQ